MTGMQYVFMCIYIYLLYDYSCSQVMQFSACLIHSLPKYLIPHIPLLYKLCRVDFRENPCQGYHLKSVTIIQGNWVVIWPIILKLLHTLNRLNFYRIS